jgi:hypothetical protein
MADALANETPGVLQVRSVLDQSLAETAIKQTIVPTLSRPPHKSHLYKLNRFYSAESLRARHYRLGLFARDVPATGPKHIS